MSLTLPKRLFALSCATLATVALVLLAIEVSLRLAAPTPYAGEVTAYFVSDPHTGYRPKPNSMADLGAVPLVINEHGHRDDPVELDKPDGTLRVLALGDSFTFGAAVEQGDTYPELLEAILGRRLEMPVEVINAGVGGWNPLQYANYFEHRGRLFAPDIVVVGLFVGNDVYSAAQGPDQGQTAVLGRRVPKTEAKAPITTAKVFLYENSHLARWIMNWQSQAVMRNEHRLERKHCGDFTEELLRVQWFRGRTHTIPDATRKELLEANLGHLFRIQEIAARDGIPVIVAIFPDENQVNPRLRGWLVKTRAYEKLDLDLPQPLLRNPLRANGIPVVDLLPAFRADPRCLFLNDTHWTAEGHLLVAQQLTPAILSAIDPTN